MAAAATAATAAPAAPVVRPWKAGCGAADAARSAGGARVCEAPGTKAGTKQRRSKAAAAAHAATAGIVERPAMLGSGEAGSEKRCDTLAHLPQKKA
mmetsp:Transcript_65148/g.132514  ORF Transcript_65148/g.132514 Transcript_65148/m.132514 type:complete len:96 (-) Transcript_65148:2-289(-)